MKIHYVAQIDERDCGVAALSMLLRNYGQENSLASLRDLAKTSLEGTTALGIVKAASTLNFETKAIKADMTLFDIRDLPLPFIAHVKKGGNSLHYYVVYGVKKNYLQIADPDNRVGKTRMSYKQFESEWSGTAIFIAPKPEFKPSKGDKETFNSYLPVIFRQKSLILNIVLASLLVTIISIVGSYYFEGLIDTFIPNGMKNTLGIISIGLIISYIIQQILNYAKNYLLIVLGQRLSIDVILSYIKHLFELPMSFFGTRRIGEITSRFNDANTIIDAISNTIISIFLDLGILIIVGITLAVQNEKLFLISLSAIPFYFLVVWIFTKPFEKMNHELMQSGSMLNSSIIESLTGIETIKALSSESVSYSKIDKEYLDILKKSFNLQRTVQVQSTIKDLLKLIFNVAVLWYGAILVINNSLSIGQLITFNALLNYFTNPLQNILNLQSKLQSARVASNRLNEVYLVPTEFNVNETISRRIPTDKTITIQHLDFSYSFDNLVLKDINITIKQNEKIALVGISGSGKSTLAKLIVNFFEPSSSDSKILIGGIDIQKIDKQALRKMVTYLPQEPYIFTGKIIDNLMLGAKDDTTMEDVFWAVEMAHIADDIEQMPQGLETEISEGSGLSGGQKQRIALARALLAKSSILILDESTSSLDVLTEKKVIDNLLALKDTTIIFVAHRLTIAQRVSKIIVMQSGQITEEGSHNDLIAQDGHYSTLFNS